MTARQQPQDRKSTRLNSSHTVIYTLSLHDALPIFFQRMGISALRWSRRSSIYLMDQLKQDINDGKATASRSEEHTSELQSHSDLHSFPTRRSSDLLPTDGNQCATMVSSFEHLFDGPIEAGHQ